MTAATEPRRLILVRHGETDYNAAGRAQGHLDVPLNERGLAQAEAVAPVIAKLAPAFVRSSDLARARVTAETIARHCSLPVRTDPRLREYHVGTNRQDRTWAEYRAEFPDEAAILAGEREGVVPGRESWSDVATRWHPALTEATEAVPPGGCGVLVAHGAALRTAVLDFLGLGRAAFDRFSPMGNCFWSVLAESMPTSFEPGIGPGWRLEAWNVPGC